MQFLSAMMYTRGEGGNTEYLSFMLDSRVAKLSRFLRYYFARKDIRSVPRLSGSMAGQALTTSFVRISLLQLLRTILLQFSFFRYVLFDAPSEVSLSVDDIVLWRNSRRFWCPVLFVLSHVLSSIIVANSFLDFLCRYYFGVNNILVACGSIIRKYIRSIVEMYHSISLSKSRNRLIIIPLSS